MVITRLEYILSAKLAMVRRSHSIIILLRRSDSFAYHFMYFRNNWLSLMLNRLSVHFATEQGRIWSICLFVWQPSLPGKLFEFDRRRGFSKGIRKINSYIFYETLEFIFPEEQIIHSETWLSKGWCFNFMNYFTSLLGPQGMAWNSRPSSINAGSLWSKFSFRRGLPWIGKGWFG